MRLTSHLAVSPLLLLLNPVGGFTNVAVAMAASILIDADHLHWLIKEKAFSIKKLRELGHVVYAQPNRSFENVTYALHSMEINLALLIGGMFWLPLNFVAFGFLFHGVCDAIHHKKNNLPLDWLFISRFVKNRNKKVSSPAVP